ncbi:MAG: helix-turn-helix domain-containing protein [Chitinophagaceae bacterium]
MLIGEQIKKTRLSKNLKQAAVAKMIGISVTAYSNIENSISTHITLARLQQIAEALKVSISDLVS